MSAESILLSGEFLPGALGSSYERAFQALSHPVHRFDVRLRRMALAWPARQRIVHRLTTHSLAARRAWSKLFNRELLAAAAQCDAPWVFAHNGEWLMPETVRALREQGRRVAIFHADNPFPPHYNHRPETLLAAREADLYMVWSERLVGKLRALGVNAHFLAFGWDEEAFPYRGDIPQGNKRTVVFIGGWAREREAFLDQIAAHVQLEIYGPAYWGTRTRHASRARACWQGRALSSLEAAQVMREAAINLNILRTQHVVDGEPDGVIMRHFEVPGAGGFLLSTRSGGATRLFPERQSGDYFSSVEECIEKCRANLNDPGSRQTIAAHAHEEVGNCHTYKQRAAEVVTLFRTVGDTRSTAGIERQLHELRPGNAAHTRRGLPNESVGDAPESVPRGPSAAPTARGK